MSGDDDENNDFEELVKTQVTELEIFDAATPVIDTTKLPGYDLGYVDGRNDMRVKDWLDGVNAALNTCKMFLIKHDVPHAEQIIIALRAELFPKTG